MTQAKLSRRRFLSVCAMAGACSALPLRHVLADMPLHHWRGILLGAEVYLTLAHPSRQAAEQLFSECVAEIKRLEHLFTLYDSHSELSRLNRQGFLDHPAPEMVDILKQAARYHQLTEGAFDVTVRPLETTPNALDIVGMDKLEIDTQRIAFAKADMSITLNGIAQGYITDRITELLTRKGLTNVLVELGEKRAIGTHPSGRPWRLMLKEQGKVAELSGQAMATSSAISPDTGKPHIITPTSGQPATMHSTICVVAQTATMADALSTGFLSLSEQKIATIKQTNSSILQVYL